jgi:phosphotransferase system  glucose/maltose/N-acetylglucosamine-specific IIC component
MNKLKRTKNNDLKTSDENIKLENHKSKAMSKVMAVLQKFGRGLMLPISILPFAGILLGIGGAISTNVTTEVGQTVGGIFQGMSNVIFANLPILFCIAIVITFTGESGVVLLWLWFHILSSQHRKPFLFTNQMVSFMM